MKTVLFLVIFMFSFSTFAAELEEERNYNVETILIELNRMISELGDSQSVTNIKIKLSELKEVLSNSPDTPLKLCSDASVNLREVPIGFRCLTSKGVTYERVEKARFAEAWKDWKSGLIWSDWVGNFANDGSRQDDIIVDSPATRACTRMGGILPEKTDFEKAERNGFREVLPNMNEHIIKYWTSSLYWPNFLHTKPYLFSAAHGYFTTVGSGSGQDVRCIGW